MKAPETERNVISNFSEIGLFTHIIHVAISRARVEEITEQLRKLQLQLTLCNGRNFLILFSETEMNKNQGGKFKNAQFFCPRARGIESCHLEAVRSV